MTAKIGKVYHLLFFYHRLCSFHFAFVTAWSIWVFYVPYGKIILLNLEFSLKMKCFLKRAEKGIFECRTEGAFRQKKPEDRVGQLLGWDLGKRCTSFIRFLSACGSNQTNISGRPTMARHWSRGERVTEMKCLLCPVSTRMTCLPEVLPGPSIIGAQQTQSVRWSEAFFVES